MLNWFDIETTGIDPDCNYLLEVGCIITDDKLNEVERLALCVRTEPSGCIAAPTVDDLMELSSPFVRDMHTASGLWDDLRSGGGLPMAEVESCMLAVVQKHSGGEKHLLCGNSVHFDRMWLRRFMPTLESSFHYRNFDVSVLKEAHRLFAPADDAFPKSGGHRALVDLEASIAELRYYLNLMGWDGGLS